MEEEKRNLHLREVTKVVEAEAAENHHFQTGVAMEMIQEAEAGLDQKLCRLSQHQHQWKNYCKLSESDEETSFSPPDFEKQE